MLSRKDVGALQAIPPGFRDRYAVRCIDHKFGPNSNGDPMITLYWEVVGLPLTDGSLATSIKRGDQEYSIAGQTLQPTWFTLNTKNLNKFFNFHAAAELPDTVDETNPDMSEYKGLLMQAICGEQEQPERQALTEEDIAAGKRVGDPILDENGQPITRRQAVIVSNPQDGYQFIKKYTGDVPQF